MIDWTLAKPQILQRETPVKSDAYMDMRDNILKGHYGAMMTGNTVPQDKPDYKMMGGGLDDVIKNAAKEFDVDPYTIKAMIKQESNGNPRAKSKKGALGAMQIMPNTLAEIARELGYEDYDPYDYSTSVRMGTYYFSKMLKQFGDESLALAAYNGGQGNVRLYGGIPPFKETRNYVRLVNNHKTDFIQTEQAINAHGLIRSNLNGQEVVLSPEVLGVLERADMDMRRDGKKGIRINSHFRTNRQQTEIYARSQQEGFLAARPGKSRHEKGNAVDIQNWQEAAPYLYKYGMHNPFVKQNDAWHFQLK